MILPIAFFSNTGNIFFYFQFKIRANYKLVVLSFIQLLQLFLLFLSSAFLAMSECLRHWDNLQTKKPSQLKTKSNITTNYFFGTLLTEELSQLLSSLLQQYLKPSRKNFLKTFSWTNFYFIAHIRENIGLGANFEGYP